MVIIETSIFTRQINELLSAEDYRALQNYLLSSPATGDVIKDSGGLRKVRWYKLNQGKRGGIRVIYYWAVTKNQLYLLLAYAKNIQDDLSKEQLNILRKLVATEFGK